MPAPDWAALAAAVLSRRDTPARGRKGEDVASLNCPTVPAPSTGTAGHLAENRRNLRLSGVPLGCVTNPEAGHLAGQGRAETPAAPETWPALARRVEALLAAGAEVRRDGPGVTLTTADGRAIHLTPTGLRSLPPALVKRLARMAEAPSRAGPS